MVLQEKHKISKRRLCRVLGLNRRTAKYIPLKENSEELLVTKIVELACNYGRYGYLRVHALLKRQQISISFRKMKRIWREQGLKVLQKQRKRRRLWLDGSCIRLRPEHPNQVWSYDFVEDRLSNGTRLRWLNIIDEYSRKCIFSFPRKSWKHMNIIETLSGLFLFHGTPEYLHSDNGSEFTANALREWLKRIEIAPLYIEPGSPWENGYCESFNGKMRDEFLNDETLKEAEILTLKWVHHYNSFRLHNAIGYLPPAPQALSA